MEHIRATFNDCLSASTAMLLGIPYKEMESAAFCKTVDKQEQVIQKYIPNFQMKNTKNLVLRIAKSEHNNWATMESLKGKGMILIALKGEAGHAAAYEDGMIYDPNYFMAQPYTDFKERYINKGWIFSEIIPLSD